MEDLIGGEDWEMGGSFYILSVNTLKRVFSLCYMTEMSPMSTVICDITGRLCSKNRNLLTQVGF